MTRQASAAMLQGDKEGDVKLAFSTNAFSRHTLETALEAISGAGYAGVEILADTPHWYPEAFDPRVAEAIRGKLERLKIAVSNINGNCTFGYWKDAPPEPYFEPSLISPVEKYREDRVRMIGNILQFAKAVGAENVSITSGKSLPTVPPGKAMRLLRENLGRVLEVAEKVGVKVGIESEPGLFIEYATELRELIDAMGSKMLGANLDIGHSIVGGEDVPTILRLLKGRIWNCHIEDLPGRKHYHLIPGTGTVDWQAMKAALVEIGYERFLTVELYTYPHSPFEAAGESIRFLRKVF